MRIEEFFKPRQACGLSLIQMVSKLIKTKNPQIGATWYGLVRIGQFDIVLNTIACTISLQLWENVNVTTTLGTKHKLLSILL